MSYVFAPPEPPSVEVKGRSERFPVHRVYCVGRNYEAHAREMGKDPTREPPFFFTKPPDAIWASPADRARVRAMAQVIACDVHPLNNLWALEYLKSQMGQCEDATNLWYRHWIAEGFRALEQSIGKHTGDGGHCFGETVTVADVCLVPQVYNARRFAVDLAPYPVLVRVSESLESLPTFAKARPEAQPDGE